MFSNNLLGFKRYGFNISIAIFFSVVGLNYGVALDNKEDD